MDTSYALITTSFLEEEKKEIGKQYIAVFQSLFNWEITISDRLHRSKRRLLDNNFVNPMEHIIRGTLVASKLLKKFLAFYERTFHFDCLIRKSPP